MKNARDVRRRGLAAYRDQTRVGSCLILKQIKVELINVGLVMGKMINIFDGSIISVTVRDYGCYKGYF